MADVEISVQAEGVEDAVGEVPEGDAPDVSGADEDAGSGAGRGRGMGKVVALIGAVLTFAQDILQVVSVFSTIARAFLAPLAVMLFRLLAPVMRLFLSVLPAWLDFVDSNEGLLGQLLTGLVPLGVFLPSIVQGVQGFWSWLQGAWKDLQNMPGDIVRGFKQALRNWKPFGGGDGLFGGAFRRNNQTRSSSGDDRGLIERGQDTIINFSGGLSSFVERIERSSGIDS